jgi:hypothetical protein
MPERDVLQIRRRERLATLASLLLLSVPGYCAGTRVQRDEPPWIKRARVLVQCAVKVVWPRR